MKKNLYTIHKFDARKIDELIKDTLVDVTITSPPYFDLKDYGFKEQIGFGQTYEEYLEDLKKVFQSVFNCTKESGTLWVIIDAYRKDGEVVPLPFDFSNKIRDVGWKLQEIIIWGKDRTVPWAHKGQMRNSFEYILVFAKSSKYKFFKDEVRDYQSLKKWWVKYPERYNPRGKTPEAIWNFDIPTQGSWGKGYIKHFCPLPEDLIAQILKLTTNEGDIVLDPFAGSGAVLAKADNMKRRFIGTEMNPEYISMFKKYQIKTSPSKRKEYEAEEKKLWKQDVLEKTIIDLRALKYAKLLYNHLEDSDRQHIHKIFVNISDSEPSKFNSLVVVDYCIFLKSKKALEGLKLSINGIILKPPLSKFGIEPNFSYLTSINEFLSLLNNHDLFVYTSKVTYKYSNKLEPHNILKTNSKEVILSPIMVDLNEKDFE
jgi:DNA modification methylase